jgi:hypothetical protein
MAFTEVQKNDFVRKIPNEVFLIDEVLIPLFTNMNQFKVIKTHGKDENGKDIVLVNEGPFGKKNYTGVIVKNEAITNASTKIDKEIVATVSTQIVMCLDSGYNSIEEGKKASFNEIIVITSKNISNSARDQLVEIAKLHRFLNISFWETKEIVSYIDKYLPEIYLVSSGTLSKYFHIMKEKCENLNELKKIAIYNGDEKHLSDIYIEPKLFSRNERIVNGKTTIHYDESSLSQLLQKPGHYIIMGSAGAGKSTLIRSEIYRLVLDYENKRREILPIFIKIKNVVKYREIEEVKSLLIKYIGDEYQLREEESKYILDIKDKITFFFDGYDEISTKEEEYVFNKMIAYIEECYGCTIIVTSRKMPIEYGDRFRTYTKWELADFSIKQIANFFDEWFKFENEKLIKDLKDHDLLDKLPNTPLVMTLIAILFESDNNVEIPSNLSELYRMFVDLLVGRWNLDRRIDSFYKANDKETFLTNIALYLHYNNHISCTKDELMNIFDNTAKDLGRKFDFEVMKNEIIKDTNLLIQNENGEYEFRHLSFQEYFVGTYLTITGNISDVITQIPHPWWNQVLYFYCGTKKINDDILPEILDQISKKNDKDKLLGLFEYGYLIQSSYKTKAILRADMLAKAMVEYSLCIKNIIEHPDDEAKKIPEIIRYLSLIEGFRIHYGSRYLEDIYWGLYENIKKHNIDSFEKALALFLLDTIISSNGKVEVLADSDAIFKQYPILQLMEDFLIRCVLMNEIDDKEKQSIIKEQLRLIMKRMKNNRDLYRSILEN